MKVIIHIVFIAVISIPSYAQITGLQMYSLRDQFTSNGFEPTLKMIRDWGFKVAEQGNLGTQGYSMAEYNRLLRKYNISLVSISATYEELKNSPDIVLQRALDLEAQFVVCFWIPHQDTFFTMRETKQAVEVFNNAGKLMEENAVTLVYHPHGYEFRPGDGDELLLDYMIRNATSFDFEMDVYWFAHAGEDPVQWLHQYPDRFKLLHLKDCSAGIQGNLNGVSDVESNVVLGTGIIDIQQVIQVAEELGIKYMFIEDESSKSVKQIPLSLKYIQGL